MKNSDTLRANKFIITCLAILFIAACKTESVEKENAYADYLNEIYDKGMLNGNALIFKNGEIVHQGSYGIANIDPIDSLALDSQFRLASVSKQFTAMAIMQLKEKGKLSYDQNLKDIIPELPYENITVKHLLQHTSGLPDYEAFMYYNWKPELEIEDPARMISGNMDVISLMAEQKPEIDFEPGEEWDYSNTGYLLLATIVSRISGLPFEQYMKENIFDPAGMESTTVYKYVVGKDPQMPNRVFGYKTELNGKDRTYHDIHYLNYVQGDGGMYSTLNDLLKWDRALYTDKLISQETLKEAFTPGKLNNGEETNYGFGWFIEKSASDKKAVFHSGGWVGFGTYIYREIEENNCFIILTNNSTSYFGALMPLKKILHDEPYEMPKLNISEVVGSKILNDGIETAMEAYYKLKAESPDDYDFSERQFNNLGYQLMGMDRNEDAAKILKLNLEEYSESANTYDSYGDALLANKDTINAVLNFKKAFEMDSTFTASNEKVKNLERND